MMVEADGWSRGDFCRFRPDEIGPWSEAKLEILRKYAGPYCRIIRSYGLSPIYIDGFAGAGMHFSRLSGEQIEGSPLQILSLEERYDHYYFIDLDEEKATILAEKVADNENVTVYQGDCNEVILEEVFPRVSWRRRERALCLLDPYRLQLDWRVIEAAGLTGAIEIFLNFPIHHMNRAVLLHDRRRVPSEQFELMTRFWGDSSWESIVYANSKDLFGNTEEMKIASNSALVKAFKKRLQDIAGFEYVPDPIPMRNRQNGIIYYLYFASPNKTGAKIVNDIFDRVLRTWRS